MALSYLQNLLDTTSGCSGGGESPTAPAPPPATITVTRLEVAVLPSWCNGGSVQVGERLFAPAIEVAWTGGQAAVWFGTVARTGIPATNERIVLNAGSYRLEGGLPYTVLRDTARGLTIEFIDARVTSPNGADAYGQPVTYPCSATIR